MIVTTLFCAVFAYLMSYALSNFLLQNADKFRMGKRVYSERVRLHKKGVPRLGGLAIYVSFFCTFLLVFFFKKSQLADYLPKIIGIFVGSTIILVCGMYDDLIRRLSYKVKFSAQIVAILCVIVAGYNINIITNPFDGKIYVGLFGIVFVIFWTLMVMNAVNLMDGLDGLACGISTLVCIGFFVMEFYSGSIFSVVMVTALIAANIAFLKFNFYPARLFLGDSGSFFLGFMLAVLAMESSIKRASAVSLIVPLLTLFIPIGSVIFTFSRRVANAQNPFKPDRMHLHYRFIRAGISHRDTVLLYYTVSFFYAVLGTFCYFMPKKFEIVIIFFAMVTMWGLYMWVLHFVSVNEKLHRIKRKKNSEKK